MTRRWCSALLSAALALGGLAAPSCVQAATAHAAPAAEISVAVDPVETEGKIGKHVRASFEKNLVVGLSRGSFEVVAGDADAASGTPTHRLRTRVTQERKDYHVTLELLSVDDDGVVFTVEDTCEVCGSREASELVRDLAASMGRNVERLTKPSTITFETNPASATIWVDGEEIGVSPLEAEVEPGQHEFRVVKDGFAAQTMDVEVTGGMRERYSLTLLRLEVDTRRVPPAWPGWTLVGVGAAGTVAGIVLLAIDRRPISSMCSGDNVDIDGDCRFRQNTLPAGAALTATGLALVVAGTALLLVRRARRKSATAQRLTPIPTGLELRF